MTVDVDGTLEILGGRARPLCPECPVTRRAVRLHHWTGAPLATVPLDFLSDGPASKEAVAANNRALALGRAWLSAHAVAVPPSGSGQPGVPTQREPLNAAVSGRDPCQGGSPATSRLSGSWATTVQLSAVPLSVSICSPNRCHTLTAPALKGNTGRRRLCRRSSTPRPQPARSRCRERRSSSCTRRPHSASIPDTATTPTPTGATTPGTVTDGKSPVLQTLDRSFALTPATLPSPRLNALSQTEERVPLRIPRATSIGVAHRRQQRGTL